MIPFEVCTSQLHGGKAKIPPVYNNNYTLKESRGDLLRPPYQRKKKEKEKFFKTLIKLNFYSYRA